MVYAGTIIEISNRKTYVFTMDCSIVALRTREEYILGQQITFTKRDKYPELIHAVSKKTLAIAAAFALLITAAATTASVFPNNSQNSFDTVCTALISVDINPSIEISINKEEEIVSVHAKNEDGILLLNNLDLTRKKLIDGVNEIITAAKEMGYIDQSKKVVLVSAALYGRAGEDTASEYAEQLKGILDVMESENDSADLLTVFIDDSAIIEEAKSNNLSSGKELLYKYAQTQDATLTADEIRSTSLNELLDRLNALEQGGDLADTLQNTTPPQPESEQTQTTPPTAEKATETPAPKPSPATDPTDTGFEPVLKTAVNGSSISFDWTGLSSSSVTYQGKKYSGFKYYKVVASQTNSHPIYPEDGYLAVISDYSDSDWSVNPEKGNYHYSPELYSGETYYVSITYVFDNGKFTSNTKSVTVPEFNTEEDAETVSSLDLSVSSTGDTLVFSWTPAGDSSMSFNGKTYKGFHFYKVVASRTNSSPKYPEDGYLTYITDCNASSWALNPYTDSYNRSPELEPGETYYFSITYVFDNGKVCSETVEHTIP